MFPLRLASVLTGNEGCSGVHQLQLTLQQHHKYSLLLGDLLRSHTASCACAMVKDLPRKLLSLRGEH